MRVLGFALLVVAVGLQGVRAQADAYIPEWGVAQNLALALLGNDPDIYATLNYQDEDPSKTPLSLDITVMTCDGPLLAPAPPPPEDVVDFGGQGGRRRLAQDAAADAPAPCYEPNRRRKAVTLATYLPRGALGYPNVTDTGKKLDIKVTYNGEAVPSQATTNVTKTCERMGATFARNSLFSRVEFFPARDCATEVCCYLVFKPILVQYQTANTATPDAHSSVAAAEAAALLLDLRSPYAATSDRCDGFLGIYGCPRVTEAVGFTA